LVRFGVMAPEHAMWTAIVCGVIYLFWCRSKFPPARTRASPGPIRSRPPIWTLPFGLAVSVVLHGFHNAMLTSFGPRAVGPAFLGTWLMVYVVARRVWEGDGRTEAIIDDRCALRSLKQIQRWVICGALGFFATTLALWPVYRWIARPLLRSNAHPDSANATPA